MQRNYWITATQIGHTVNEEAENIIDSFPIESALTRGSWYLLVFLACDLIGSGWIVQRPCHVCIPVILQFVQGFLGTYFYSVFSILLVDVHPASPSTASITACVLAASGVSALQPKLELLSPGWYFTILRLTSMIFGSAAVLAVRVKGTELRDQRRKKNCQILKK